MDEIIVTATRSEQDIFKVPYSADIVTSKDIQERQLSRTLPESLKEIPGVMVQKTSFGQGSPYIRGFTGYDTLLLIDGIRLNNSVFRSGPNQYANTIDPLSIERVELVKGPSSVLYGSDAIGGTVNAFTVDPGPNKNRVFYRFSTAEESNTGRLQLSNNIGDLWAIAGGSLKDYGDLHAGGSVGTQPHTGYNEQDYDLKFQYYLGDDSSLTFAHQKVNQDDVWRTHTTIYGISWKGTKVGDEKERKHDQDRELTYLQYKADNLNSFIDNLQISLSYHRQEEERFRVKKDKTSDFQGFDVGTSGLLTQLTSKTSMGILTCGLDYYEDRVDSFSRSFKADGSFNKAGIQGPVADDSSYKLLGIYLQDAKSFSEKLDIILGARYTYAKVEANKVEDPVTKKQISLSDNWDNVVGNIRFSYLPDRDKSWNLYGGVSQGFRTPTLADLTMLDDTSGVETPSLGLKPEKYIVYELGLKRKKDDWQASLTFFYTDIEDMIVASPTGNLINGIPEVRKDNVGDGFVQGVELAGSYLFFADWLLFGSFVWTEGEVDQFLPSGEKVRKPMTKIMPATFKTGIRYDNKTYNFWVETDIVTAAKADKLSLKDQSDTQRIPPGGTPGYTVLNFRSGIIINKSIRCTLALENITDEDYRIHGSGVNEPRRNLVGSMAYEF
ncbi:MAG TPA: TonB-dependent receptor [Syntrophales bacterium]|nr:TonB-dependent receptor [Syntrophales bacterium]